jgi:hypothetical protein
MFTVKRETESSSSGTTPRYSTEPVSFWFDSLDLAQDKYAHHKLWNRFWKFLNRAGSASSFVLYWVMRAPPNIIFLSKLRLPAKNMPTTKNNGSTLPAT